MVRSHATCSDHVAGQSARLLNSYVPRSLFYCAFGRRLADALTPFALSQS